MRNQASRDIILEKLQQDLKKIHYETKPTIVTNDQKIKCYHYTNYQALVGIIEKKQLWFTDYRGLADRTEIIYSDNLIYEALTESNKNGYWQNALSTYAKILFREHGYSYKNSGIYVCSFCQHHDFLPAWRFYADNGTGFSIGFSFSVTSEISTSPQAVISNVIYDKDEFKNYAKKLIAASAKYKKNNSQNAKLLHEIDQLLVSNLISILPCYKTKDFSSEVEIRQYLQYITLKNKTYPATLPLENLIKCQSKTEPSTPFLKKYNSCIERYCYDLNPSEISEIWVGPRCDFREAKNALIKLLQQNGMEQYKIKIKESEVLYR